MQKQQVFKVKGMQRDLSMANTNGEFAYEIVNMRLLPAEENAGLSLTNEKGTLQISNLQYEGTVIGQCPTNDSLVFFTCKPEGSDYIYELYQEEETWKLDLLFQGDLNFSTDNKIEAIFNYETLDIQKIYWIDKDNQLRCINIVESPTKWGMERNTDDTNWQPKNVNNQYFNSVKEINSLPNVEIERVPGGSFTAGVLQYYITYFNKFSTESPIIYTSPLLYIAHSDRGSNVNDQVAVAFKLTLNNLDTVNWEYIRIYATHRTSLDATPEGSIITEINLSENETITFTDFGSSRTSITPTDLYYTGGKFVKAGTMTVKDQVMFLGNLDIESPDTIAYTEIKELFDNLRESGDVNNFFSTETRKQRENKLSEYDDTHYYYKNQLSNTEPITHYKYGEKYRFGISVMDKYGVWSNPIWIKDEFIMTPPEQVSETTLELPCPSLNLSGTLDEIEGTPTLWEYLQSKGAKSIKPLVVFPKEEERKVVAQGVVCPTVYNLKDRKENGPYAQASWFMRPNAPVDLWGIGEDPVNLTVNVENYNETTDTQSILINHYSDLIDSNFNDGDKLHDNRAYFGYFGTSFSWNQVGEVIKTSAKPSIPTPPMLMLDDAISYSRDVTKADTIYAYAYSDGKFNRNGNIPIINFYEDTIQKGSWVEFRHNYALRSKGWSFGSVIGGYANGKWKGQMFGFGKKDSEYNREMTSSNIVHGSFRSAEIGSTRYHHMLPVNRLWRNESNSLLYFRNIGENDWDVDSNFITGNSAYYVDSSIVTLNTPELELVESLWQTSTQEYDFRIIGLIPLTATVSDMSLEISNPPSNPDSYDVGPHVVHLNNKNIGHHGFKGVVSSNTYFSNPKSGTYGYRTVLLNPWQTTGTIQAVSSTSDGFGDYETLKKKTLSNLRYSASSYYFGSGKLDLKNPGNPSDELNLELNNKVLLGEKVIGWKPANGTSIAFWTNKENTNIIKLLAGKSNLDLVYGGNIDVIATATYGDDRPAEIFPALSGVDDVKNRYDNPIFYGHGELKYSGKGASIKYKSSPHAVIAFKEFQKNELWGHNQKYTQEILPAFTRVNTVGIPSGYRNNITEDVLGELYEDATFNSIPHQSQFYLQDQTTFGLPLYDSCIRRDKGGHSPLYGWLWLGEVYRETDPTFGGESLFALSNNLWETAGDSQIPINTRYEITDIKLEEKDSTELSEISIASLNRYIQHYVSNTYVLNTAFITQFEMIENNRFGVTLRLNIQDEIMPLVLPLEIETRNFNILNVNKEDIQIIGEATITIPQWNYYNPSGSIKLASEDNGQVSIYINHELLMAEFPVTCQIKEVSPLLWSIGDTYYQRFDTLKTYAYSDSDQNSIIDITSFMVETRVNIDGRYDRNRGQESNLQMSPTNFNLMNDVYSQRDNFFTYRILDDDVQSRTRFPNQITWSLSKTAGATVDAWMNITLASILDLDGAEGELRALKTFNNSIMAFQDSGISQILFNSRVQIPTSEMVPIQIANSGKVDGQQFVSRDVGCQDKWNIVTTPMGLYFVDYFNKSIYRFNGQLEDLSSSKGFRGWCDKYINSNSSIIGYYDVKNREVMYYDSNFRTDSLLDTPIWLGYSELTNTFSSFYTYPEAILSNIKGNGIWLYNTNNTGYMYQHQAGSYNDLLDTKSPYGLTVVTRQDSNMVKTFTNVEFRADTYINNNNQPEIGDTFNTLSIWTENDEPASSRLEYNKYRPSNLKKMLRTWRANIPRPIINNGISGRFVNQWAKIGLWKKTYAEESMPRILNNEKTILHDLAVWYSE